MIYIYISIYIYVKVIASLLLPVPDFWTCDASSVPTTTKGTHLGEL